MEFTIHKVCRFWQFVGETLGKCDFKLDVLKPGAHLTGNSINFSTRGMIYFQGEDSNRVVVANVTLDRENKRFMVYERMPNTIPANGPLVSALCVVEREADVNVVISFCEETVKVEDMPKMHYDPMGLLPKEEEYD